MDRRSTQQNSGSDRSSSDSYRGQSYAPTSSPGNQAYGRSQPQQHAYGTQGNTYPYFPNDPQAAGYPLGDNHTMQHGQPQYPFYPAAMAPGPGQAQGYPGLPPNQLPMGQIPPWMGNAPSGNHGHSATPQPYQAYAGPAQIMLPEASASTGSAQGSTMHYCSRCPASFPRRTDLNRHVRSIHTNETPYECMGCKNGFVRSDARGRHWKEDPSCKERHDREQHSQSN